MEVASSNDEQEFVAGKAKAMDASTSGEAGPLSAAHSLSQQAHLSGQPGAPEDKSPAANQHDHCSFLEDLFNNSDYQCLVHILSLLPIFVSLSLL